MSLFLVDFADEWFTFFPSGALESIRGDLGLSYAQIGLVLAALATGGLAGHGLSIAADYVDRRVLMASGAVVVAVGLFGFALAQGFVLLVAAALLWGAATDAFNAGSEVTLVQLFPDDLARALARANLFGAVGDLLGPLTLAAAIGLGLGWRWVFGFGGIAMLVYAAVIARQTFPPRSTDAEADPIASLFEIARDRRILRLALVDALFGLLDEPFQGYSIAYFERVRGLSPTVATAIIAAWVVAGVVGYGVVSAVTARGSSRALLRGFGGLLAVAVALIVVGPFPAIEALAAVAFGFSAAVFYSILQATYLGLRADRAGTVGAVVSTIGLSAVAFPALVGAVADRFGLTVGLGLYAIVPLLMLALLFGEE